MGRRRDHLEVVADILTEALRGANKTSIIYRANLNFLRFDRYFSELREKGLIVTVNTSDGRMVYQTTEKGKTFLNIIKKAKEVISE